MKREDNESIARIENAVAEIRNGRMVILVDDENRENEGDLVMAAELATPEAINFMALHGRGLICLSLTPERCDQLKLPMMVQDNSSGFGPRKMPRSGCNLSILCGKNSTSRSTTDEAKFRMPLCAR